MADDAPSLYVAEPRSGDGTEAAASPPAESAWPPPLYLPGAGPGEAADDAADEPAATPNLEEVASEALDAEGAAPAAADEEGEAPAGEPAAPGEERPEEPAPLRRLRDALGRHPDFPDPGQVFHDLEPAFGDPEILDWISERLAGAAEDAGCDHLCAPEPVGVVLGGAVAARAGLALVPLRRPRPMPDQSRSEEHESPGPVEPGGLELREGALGEGDRVLLLNDRLADGRLLAAAARLVRASGAEIGGIATVLEEEGAGGRERLEEHEVTSLLLL